MRHHLTLKWITIFAILGGLCAAFSIGVFAKSDYFAETNAGLDDNITALANTMQNDKTWGLELVDLQIEHCVLHIAYAATETTCDSKNSLEQRALTFDLSNLFRVYVDEFNDEKSIVSLAASAKGKSNAGRSSGPLSEPSISEITALLKNNANAVTSWKRCNEPHKSQTSNTITITLAPVEAQNAKELLETVADQCDPL